MAEALLELAGLRKRFGGLVVTDDVSLTVAAGEIHALIGPNGAGKTTLVQLVAGALRPDAGVVRLAGRDVSAWSVPRRARAGLGRSFQTSRVIAGFSARENVMLALQRRGGAGSGRDAAEAALAAIGLGARAGDLAGALSHGERRQLELAVVLAARPRVLLLDEPLAGAGAEEGRRLVAMLDGLRGRFGMLLIEHDMDAVFALADRISVLVAGRLVVTGPAAAIRAHPEVRRAYLGEDAEA